MGKPFQTVYKANSLAILPGTLIDIGAGVFEENAPLILSSGISLAGAGKDKTFLSLKNAGNAAFNSKNFFIQLVSENFKIEPTSISGFTINGSTSPQLSGGIVICNRANVNIQHVNFDHISWGAVWAGISNDCPVKNILMDDVTFLECGLGTSEYASGAIMPAWVENLEIKNFTIRATESSTGYGITAIGYGVPRGSWKNVKIHDGTIDLKPTGSWNNGLAPNISIEVNRVSPISNCEVYNNVIRNNISMVGQNNIRSYLPSIRVHHNTLDLHKDNYALELSIDDFEFDNNYILCKSFLLGGFYEPRYNTKIHHNIFRGGYAEYGSSSFYFGQADSLYFYNNVLDWLPAGSNPGDSSVFSISPSMKYMVIKNNIFLGNRTTFLELVDQNIQNMQVTNNNIVSITFGNRTGVYKNNFTQNPQIMGSGNFPDPFYRPSGSNINLVDMGTTGLLPVFQYTGPAPDVGAYEYNMITGINDEDISEVVSNDFKIYPNPLSKNQALNFTNNSKETFNMRVKNKLGVLLFETSIESIGLDNKTTVQLPNLPEGCYFVNINGNDFNRDFKLVITE